MGIEPISVVDIANYAYPKQLLSLFNDIGFLSRLIVSGKIGSIGGS